METQRPTHDDATAEAPADLAPTPVDGPELAQTMKRVGLVYILALVIHVRIDAREIALPFLAAGLAWLLRDLHTMVSTRDERRAWVFLTGSAWVVTGLAWASLIPAVEPAGPSVVMAIMIVIGTIAYADIVRSFAGRQGWTEVAESGRRAGQLLWVTLAVTVLLICSAYGFADPASETAANVIFGRELSTTALLVGLGLYLIAWIPALLALQRTSQATRRLLAGVAESVGDPAPASA